MSALAPLCDAAGIKGCPDTQAAAELFDVILLGSEQEVEELFRSIKWYAQTSIVYGADSELIKKGELFAALKTVNETPNWPRAQEFNANQERSRRGVELSPLDAAVLKYTGLYIHASTIPSRKPDTVEPELLSAVLEIIATAERASDGVELPSWAKSEPSEAKKEEWKHLQNTVQTAVKNSYPDLADDAVRAVGVLLCSEASRRARTKDES